MTNQAKSQSVGFLRVLVVLFALSGLNQITAIAKAPPSPDLIITDVWQSGGQVHYQIQNIGDAAAASGHVTSLVVDGAQQDADTVPSSLAPGERLNRTFTPYTWSCTPVADTLIVNADSTLVVAEIQEGNNQRTENWTCDKDPPQITIAPVVSLITTSSARIAWRTDELSDSTVLYSRLAGLYGNQVYDQTPALNHYGDLINLEPYTTYHFVVQSADAGGNVVTSADHYFSTLPSSDPVDTTITFLAATGQRLPLEFTAEAEDNEDIERVTFMLDGDLVETDFSSPFRFVLDPYDLGMSTAEFYQSHDIEAQSFAPSGDSSGDLLVWDAASPVCFPVEFDFSSPCDGCLDIVLADGSVVPPNEWEFRVSIKASETAYELLRNRWDDELVEFGTPVERIEFYVDDTATPVLVAHETEWLNQDWDPVGLTVGAHQLVAKAFAHGCPFPVTDTHTLVVRQYEPTVEVRYRFVSAAGDGNMFRIALGIDNNYLEPVHLEQLTDDLTGFHVLPSSNSDYTVTSHYSWDEKRSHVEVSFDPGFMLDRWDTYDVEFHAVPILYSGFEDYHIGSLGVVLGFEDPSGALHYVTDSLTREGLAFQEEVRDAIAEADYLIVTNPRNLFGLYPEADVNALIDAMAELAAAKQGVLGYVNTHPMFGSSFSVGNRLAAGEVLPAEHHINGEVVILQAETERIKVYGGEGFLRSFDCEGLHPNDGLAVGNVRDVDAAHGVFPSGEEIIVADGEGDYLGRIDIFQFWKNENVLVSIENFSSDYELGGRVACADFDGLWVPADSNEEIVVVDADGELVVYDRDGASWSEAVSFGTQYSEGDFFAVGNVALDSSDEIIIGDRDTSRIYVHTSASAHVRSFPLALDADDEIVVADVWDTHHQEIIVISADRDEIIVLSCSCPDPVSIDATVVETRTRDIVPLQEFSAGDVLGLPKEDLIIANPLLLVSMVRISQIVGEIELVNGSGDPSLTAAAFDDLIDEGGEWAEKLMPGWATDGHLLLVGETDILPACSKSFSLLGGDTTVDYTDYTYSDTSGDATYPELSCARIIGDDALRLAKPIQASLDIEAGVCTLENGLAAAVSGHEEGPSGGADDIDFLPERESIAARLEDRDFTVVKLHEPDEDTFFTHTAFCDVIHLAAHGWSTGWDVIESNEVCARLETGSVRPFVFGSSCLTGRYIFNNSLAEAFLDSNASSYSGATVSTRSPYHSWLAAGFYDELGPGVTLGECLRNARINVIGAGGRRYEEEYEHFVAVAQHLYGDAKLEISWTSPKQKGTTKSRGFATLTTQSAKRDVAHVTIPAFTVTSHDGLDYVTIPGGAALLEPGYAEVPKYTVSFDYPAGTRVQDVTLALQAGLSTHSDFDLPLVTPAQPGARPLEAATAKRAPGGEEWWPDVDFDWNVVEKPGGSMTLLITIHPFFYNANTAEAMYYTYYEFDISTHTTDLDIMALDTDKQAYDVGETVTAELFVSTSQPSVDLIVEAAILRHALDAVDGLPLRTLSDVTGLISCAFEWDGSGFPADTYIMQVSIRDLTGHLLARGICDFTYGYAAGDMGALSIDPECFAAGDAVDLSSSFVNTGDGAVSGIMVVELQTADHATVETFTQEFSDLVPGQSQAFNDTLPTASLDRIDCRFVGYTLYEGKTTDHQTLWHQIGGDLNLDRSLNALDLSALANHVAGNLPQGAAPFLACQAAADVNRDDSIDASDAHVLARKLIED